MSAIQLISFLEARRDPKTDSALSMFLWSKKTNKVNPEVHLETAALPSFQAKNSRSKADQRVASSVKVLETNPMILGVPPTVGR